MLLFLQSCILQGWAAVSAHSSLVVLLVFIVTTYIVFVLLVLEQMKCINIDLYDNQLRTFPNNSSQSCCYLSAAC